MTKALKALTMKRFRVLAAFALACAMSTAHPHGQPKPQHGGVVAAANDLWFELVPQGDRTTIYVFDHDKPLDVQTYSGKLTVLAGADKAEGELKPAGGNRLDARVTVPKGAKVVAVLLPSGKKPLTVRFALK
jgi:hypothetical protein